ncbi:hypothetical protein B0A53_03204 [Rhodotorula sp. CCFEE 5036]|nr:hypothetical protein B0A53_03204 [Rhodotorula sp. CCFEE 5036]
MESSRPGANTGRGRSVLRLAVFGVAVFLFLASSSIFDRQSERTCPAQLLASTSPSAAAVQRLFRELVEVPEAEVGQVAICASVRTEGRFITEWLLYHRIMGVDRFYLYDSGSTDNTLEMLQPWMDAGTVKLHAFAHDQAGHYQTTGLETCSRTYGPTTEWLLEADVDEFHVATPYFTGLNRSQPILLSDVPDQPLRRILLDNWLYTGADAVVVSRMSFKNAGLERLPNEASLLRVQTLRDFYHSLEYDKLAFTKSLIHTRRQSESWVLPGAHFLKHATLDREAAKIITADGRPVKLITNDAGARTGKQGVAYMGKHYAPRVYEPLVMFHYVERDLEDCLRKLQVAQKLRKGGWRDKAGVAGCKDYDVYQESDEWVPLHEKDSFYGGAVRDRSIADSWFGLYLPLLISASEQVAREMSSKGELLQPTTVDPHPKLVEFWQREGLSTLNGMPLEQQGGGGRTAEEQG